VSVVIQACAGGGWRAVVGIVCYTEKQEMERVELSISCGGGLTTMGHC